MAPAGLCFKALSFKIWSYASLKLYILTQLLSHWNTLVWFLFQWFLKVGTRELKDRVVKWGQGKEESFGNRESRGRFYSDLC